MNSADSLPHRTSWLPAAAVFLLTVAVYLPTLNHAFTNWDDQVYVTANPLLYRLTPANLKAIFTTFYFTDYLPINLLSYVLDRLLWDYAAWGYHLTNMVLHGLNASLAYLLLAGFCGRGAAPIIGALWFGWHPLQVESVAWVAERKNVLSLAFFLGTFLTYCRALEGASLRRWRYVAALALFTLAVLSKSSVVVLPAILLAYHLCERRQGAILTLPFFAVAVAASILTILSQAPGGEILHRYHGGSFSATLMTVPALLLGYLLKLLLPAQLNVYYNFVAVSSATAAKLWLSLLGLGAVAGVACFLWRRYRRAVFGLIWFFLGLAPVTNIIPFPALFAERYAYLPTIGLAISGSCVAVEAGRTWRASGRSAARRASVALCLCALASLAALTLIRLPVWRNSVTLWQDSVLKSPSLAISHNNLGGAYRAEKFYTRAMLEYKVAIGLNNRYPKALINLSAIYLERGRPEQALAAAGMALRLRPRSHEAHTAVGAIYQERGHYDRAIAEFLLAVALKPDDVTAYTNLAAVLIKRALLSRALAQLGTALSLHPGSLDAHTNLAAAYTKLRRLNKATAELLTALKIAPHNAELYVNLGATFSKLEVTRRAEAAFRTALQLQPDATDARTLLAAAYLERRLYSKATAELLAALQRRPGDAEAQANLAAVYLRLKLTAKAVARLRKALRSKPESSVAQNKLAAAYLETGLRSKATAALLTAVFHDARFESGWNNLGDLLSMLERPRAAARAYHGAVGVNPRSANNWNNLGSAFFESGRLDRATLAFLHSLSADADYAKAWNNLGNIHTRVGSLRRGSRALLRALALNPGNGNAHNNLGSVLNRQDRFDAALVQFKTALWLNPRQVQSAFNMATVLKLRGRRKLALTWYEFFRRHWRGVAHLADLADREIAGLRETLNARQPH